MFERRQLTPADLPDTLPEAGGRVFARRNPELAGASAPRNAAAEQRASRQAERVRIFLDSNLPTAATWGLDKAVLSLCAPRICRLVVIEAVRDEVEENLLVRRGGLATAEANRVLDDYARLIALMKPEMAPYPGQGIDLNVEPKHEPVGAL